MYNCNYIQGNEEEIMSTDKHIFGWDYPSGCSGPPEGYQPSEFVLATWEFFEGYNMGDKTIQKIIDIVEEWEVDIDE